MAKRKLDEPLQAFVDGGGRTPAGVKVLNIALTQRIKDAMAENPRLNYVQAWEISEQAMAREGISDIDRDHGTVVVKISAESHSLMSSYKKLYGLTFAQLVDLALGALIDQSEDGKLHGLHGVRK